MVVTVSSYKILRDKIESFKSATYDLASQSLKDKGVLRFDVLQNDGDEGRFLVLEAYQSESFRKAHLDTPHYVSWRREVPEFFEQGTTTVFYSPVHPEPEVWAS
ncbi:antibiotic biosynthesis monooxygenase [Leptospira perolatii]|uniref:Antibiotic biosynthesis monooxygenase n=1 Tax=Leptospira perolatii TaxID=2023191 RepID=A0A2M9ZQZ8_9LEPT|nr:antibiotic biosynthesis monooxygenase [Leptospira perolatii]PJZ74455.1 antibiotic biosynthesis monooxygenase [Leptospira perolatii]